MQLIVITPHDTAKDELIILNSLLPAGLSRVHIRKPSFHSDDLRNYLCSIDPVYHKRIVICDCFELWDEFELGGIHLNSASRNDLTTWEKIRHIPSQAISTSFHSWLEFEQNEFPYGYAFISPVFDSISKAGYKAAIDLKGSMEMKEKRLHFNKNYPQIIGLGGVGEQQIKILYDYGFDGAALLGAIWQVGDPVKKFQGILQSLTSLQKP